AGSQHRCCAPTRKLDRINSNFLTLPLISGAKVMSTPQPLNGNGHHPLHQTPADGGKLIVLTAPLTEAIDHAGYFIQMGMASMPIWMEGVMNSKYPNWRDVEY